MTFRLTCFLIALLAGTWCRSQVSFVLHVAENKIARNQPLQVEYTLLNASDFEDFRPPVFRDWQVVSGPMHSQQQVIVNNKVEKKASYIYVVTAKRTGKLQVPAATAVLGGRTYQCKPVTVQVTRATAATPSLPPLIDDVPAYYSPQELQVRRGEDPQARIREHVFIRTELSKARCFVGEPVQVTYKLYTSLNPELQVMKQPAFSGCSVTELPFDDYPSSETYKGRTYHVYTFRRVQLVPLQTGRLELPSGTVQATLDIIKPDEGYARQRVTVNISNETGTLEAQPLRVNGSEYTGPLGRFRVALKLENDTITAGENNKLLVEVTGSGNFQLVAEPEVQWPEGTRHYPSAVTEEMDKSGFPVEGKKTFAIPFIAEREGVLQIPPVRLAFFNPDTRRLDSARSDSVRLLVTSAAGRPSVAELNARNDAPNRRYLWLVPVVALVGAFTIIISSRGHKKTPAPAPQPVAAEPQATEPLPVQATPAPEQTLQEALQAENDRRFYLLAKEALHGAVCAATGQLAEGEAPWLSLKDSAPQLYTEAYGLFEQINRNLYSPFASNERQEVSEKLEELVKRLQA